MTERGDYIIEIGNFCLDVPKNASVSVTVSDPSPHFPDLRVWTSWKISFERFYLTINHSAHRNLSDLGDLIVYQTRVEDPGVHDIIRNGLTGVTHGKYTDSKTHMDWWFEADGFVLTMTLLSQVFPHTSPTDAERAEHARVIDSVRRSSQLV